MNVCCCLPRVIDDCWANTSRDSNGDLAPDPARFPDGIPSLVKYVEDRGFYLGLYTCAGTETCKVSRKWRYRPRCYT